MPAFVGMGLQSAQDAAQKQGFLQPHVPRLARSRPPPDPRPGLEGLFAEREGRHACRHHHSGSTSAR
ncbi:hypothetical protein ACRAWF_16740 [Streptomyces sp. L7]